MFGPMRPRKVVGVWPRFTPALVAGRLHLASPVTLMGCDRKVHVALIMACRRTSEKILRSLCGKLVLAKVPFSALPMTGTMSLMLPAF